MNHYRDKEKWDDGRVSKQVRKGCGGSMWTNKWEDGSPTDQVSVCVWGGGEGAYYYTNGKGDRPGCSHK